jgi:hypothetical protein
MQPKQRTLQTCHHRNHRFTKTSKQPSPDAVQNNTTTGVRPSTTTPQPTELSLIYKTYRFSPGKNFAVDPIKRDRV